jgi:hypothetical protein
MGRRPHAQGVASQGRAKGASGGAALRWELRGFHHPRPSPNHKPTKTNPLDQTRTQTPNLVFETQSTPPRHQLAPTQAQLSCQLIKLKLKK